MRLLKSLSVLAVVLALALPAAAQDRAKAEEVVVAFAAEPRTLLPNTIVDWTTNNMLEHMHDRLVDRDPKTYKPIPMLATSWKVVENTTWVFPSPYRCEVPQRRALRRPERQGLARLHQGPRQQDALRGALDPRQGGSDRRSPHRALRHGKALAGFDLPTL